jgi:chromosome segregation ATPase
MNSIKKYITGLIALYLSCAPTLSEVTNKVYERNKAQKQEFTESVSSTYTDVEKIKEKFLKKIEETQKQIKENLEEIEKHCLYKSRGWGELSKCAEIFTQYPEAFPEGASAVESLKQILKPNSKTK